MFIVLSREEETHNIIIFIYSYVVTEFKLKKGKPSGNKGNKA